MEKPRDFGTRNAPQKTTRTIAYLRVSTDKQADEGVSLDAQRAKVLAYAQIYDLELVEVVVDAGESAKTLDRPGLRRALRALKRGDAQALLVVKLDRLTRSVRDLGGLIEKHFGPDGAALLSVSEQIDTRSAAGRLVLNVLAAVSQWEREAVSERTATAMRHKASAGEYTGGRPPYGFKVTSDGVRVEPEPTEQATILEARRLRGLSMTLSEVAAELAKTGRVSRAGNPFAKTQIARMLTAES